MKLREVSQSLRAAYSSLLRWCSCAIGENTEKENSNTDVSIKPLSSNCQHYPHLPEVQRAASGLRELGPFACIGRRRFQAGQVQTAPARGGMRAGKGGAMGMRVLRILRVQARMVNDPGPSLSMAPLNAGIHAFSHAGLFCLHSLGQQTPPQELILLNLRGPNRRPLALAIVNALAVGIIDGAENVLAPLATRMHRAPAGFAKELFTVPAFKQGIVL